MLDIVSLVMLISKGVDIIFICFVLFFERKESSKRGLWLFILAFIPVGGIIIYMLGSGHFFTGSYRMKLTNRLVSDIKKDSLEDQMKFLEENKSKIKNPIVEKELSLIKMNIEKGESALTSAASARIYTEGEKTFTAMYEDIKSARKSIYMEYFIFHKDKIGKKFMELLVEKAAAGVEVRVMIDDLGSRFTPLRFFKKLKKAGGHFHSFFQLRLGLPLTINYRNHRKLCIIDGETGWTGGVNIGDEYMNNSDSWKINWRDTAVRVTGDAVVSMQSLFISDWYSATAWKKRKHKIQKRIDDFFPPEIFSKISGTLNRNRYDMEHLVTEESGLIPCQLVTSDPNGFHAANIESALMRIISTAKKYVYIQTPYFTPDESFVSCLKLAAFNGVDVRVQIPRDWDKFYVKAASYQFVRELSESGIKFYLYPGFIHAKSITCDDEIVSIGSTNIDNRSFNLHFENNLFFYDKKLACEHKQIFLNDEKISHYVEKGEFDRKFILIRAWWSFAKLFGPLM